MTLDPASVRDPLGAISAIATAHQHQPGGLLPALHAVQDALGHVPPEAVPLLAQAFNRSRAEVQGVLHHYPHFRHEPAGRQLLQLCRAEACQACGAESLAAQAEALLGCATGHTRADGAVTLEAVYCLGLCASAPALSLDGTLHARVSPERLGELLDPLRPDQ